MNNSSQYRAYIRTQKELKREEQERYLKEQRQKEELIRGNLELINQKNQLKIKELEEKLKYYVLYIILSSLSFIEHYYISFGLS